MLLAAVPHLPAAKIDPAQDIEPSLCSLTVIVDGWAFVDLTGVEAVTIMIGMPDGTTNYYLAESWGCNGTVTYSANLRPGNYKMQVLFVMPGGRGIHYSSVNTLLVQK